jgi:hypothetical protein
MVIPYHASGLPVRYTAPLAWKDYTHQQHEHWLPGKGPKIPEGASDAEIAEISARFRKKLPEHLRAAVLDNGSPMVRQSQFINAKTGTSNAQAKKNYLKICQELGVSPVFEQFLDHPNYIKLRKDFARTDTPFRVPERKFNMKAASDVTRRWIAEGGTNPEPDQAIVDQLLPQYKANPEGKWASERLQKEAPKRPPAGVGTIRNPAKEPEVLARAAAGEFKPPTGPGQKGMQQQIEEALVEPRKVRR